MLRTAVNVVDLAVIHCIFMVIPVYKSLMLLKYLWMCVDTIDIQQF